MFFMIGYFPEEKVRVYNNMACLSRRKGLYNQAIDILNKALKIIKNE